MGSPFEFQPAKEVKAGETVTLLLDCTNRLRSGVTISAVTGTNEGRTLGIVAPTGVGASTLAIQGTDVTSTVDGRTISANKALTIKIQPTASAKKGRYEVQVWFSTSNGDTRVGILVIEIH